MKKYKVEYTIKAIKQLRKLDKYTRNLIYAWISKNLVGYENPKVHGKSLVGDKSGKWRYRIGDYRIIAEIQEKEIIVLVINVGHRKEVYK